MTDAFIYDHVRTPRGRGKADGALHEVTALALATQALASLRARNKLDPTIVDERRIELVARAQRRQRLGRKIKRGHLVERAVRLAAPARGADVIVDEGVGHEALRSSATIGKLLDCDPAHKLREIKSFMISFVPA